MIVTDCNIQVSNDSSIADKNIIIYRGDYNVQVTFTITQANDYRYRSSSANENLIESTQASFGQILIKNKNNEEAVILSKVAPTNKGKVTLTILQEYIDELTELGEYDYQIRLFSDKKQARITIPPIQGQLIIKEPLIFDSGDDDINLVDMAQVDETMVTNNEEDLPILDADGNYIKTEWSSGDIISAERLNKTEEAIDYIYKNSTTAEDISNAFGECLNSTMSYINEQGFITDDDLYEKQYANTDYVDTVCNSYYDMTTMMFITKSELDGKANVSHTHENYVDTNYVDSMCNSSYNMATAYVDNVVGEISELLDLFNGGAE